MSIEVSYGRFSSLVCCLYVLQALGEKSAAKLAEAFKGIPNSVTFLNLSKNALDKKSDAELNQAFKRIPDSVISVDLSCNSFEEKANSVHEMSAMLAENLPVHVHSVQINGEEFNIAPYQKQKTLDKIDAQLVILAKKTKELNDRKCTNAYEAAYTLCNALKELQNNLKNDEEHGFNYKSFR